MPRLFTIIGRDGPGGPEGRKRHRAQHLANLEDLRKSGRLAHAGPLLDPEGQPVGSLLLIEAEHIDEAKARAAADPYVTEGIFASYEVLETRAVFGDRADDREP